MVEDELGKQGVALYYPHISIGSAAWLKSTLLLWDSVRRIVPAGARTEDDTDVSRLAGAGLLQNTSPFEYRERAESLFFEKLDLPDGNGLALTDALKGQLLESTHPFTDAEYIHVGKVSDSVLCRMRAQGWAKPVHGGWLHFDHGIGRLYMCSLATAMAAELSAPLVTDESPYLGWAHLFADGDGAGRRTTSSCLAALNIDWPGPTDLVGISTDQFLAFHDRRAPERRAFREALQSIAADLARIEDRNQLGDAIARHRRDVEQRLRDLREAQQELGLKTLVGALNMNCPTLIAAAAATPFVGPVAGAMIAGGGIALSVASWAADLRGERRSLRRSESLYYALAVRSEL